MLDPPRSNDIREKDSWMGDANLRVTDQLWDMIAFMFPELNTQEARIPHSKGKARETKMVHAVSKTKWSCVVHRDQRDRPYPSPLSLFAGDHHELHDPLLEASYHILRSNKQIAQNTAGGGGGRERAKHKAKRKRGYCRAIITTIGHKTSGLLEASEWRSLSLNSDSDMRACGIKTVVQAG